MEGYKVIKLVVFTVLGLITVSCEKEADQTGIQAHMVNAYINSSWNDSAAVEFGSHGPLMAGMYAKLYNSSSEPIMFPARRRIYQEYLHGFESTFALVNGKDTLFLEATTNKEDPWISPGDSADLFIDTLPFDGGIKLEQEKPLDILSIRDFYHSMIAQGELWYMFDPSDTIFYERYDTLAFPNNFKVSKDQGFELSYRDTSFYIQSQH